MNTHTLRSIAVCTVLVAACSKGSTPRALDSLAQTDTATSAPAMPFFEILGTQGENAYDNIKTANWQAARASVDSLSGALTIVSVADTARHGAGITQSMASLDSAVTLRSRIRGLTAANQLTRIGASLPGAATTRVPAAVTLLDFHGRELEIAAETKDAPRLARTAAAIHATWTDVRPLVVSHGGTAEAATFDALVASVMAAKSPTQYARLATPLLDHVDALEVVFTR